MAETGAPRQGARGVPRENILQLLPDAVAPSNEELAAYWRKVAKRALPFLGRRPLKLVRHTRGTLLVRQSVGCAGRFPVARLPQLECGRNLGRRWVEGQAQKTGRPPQYKSKS
jgi:hypothetical protein